MPKLPSKQNNLTQLRKEHIKFYEREIAIQIQEFKNIVDRKAISLLEEDEVFITSYFGVNQQGHCILEFSKKRGLPRIGSHLCAFLVTDHYANYRNWGQSSYFDLHKEKIAEQELSCVWHGLSLDKQYYIAGFKGIEEEFLSKLKKDVIVLLGPSSPPLDYLKSLKEIVEKEKIESSAGSILELTYRDEILRLPSFIKQNSKADFIIDQLELNDTFLLQGPPGTGKTYLTGEICSKLVERGASVLILSPTNRALLEVASKESLGDTLGKGKIYKLNLSLDEERSVPKLNKIKELSSIKGGVVLSTFYLGSITSVDYINSCNHFDYVIIDEASQGFLATFSMAKLLGHKQLWIGDVNQLPPIVLQSLKNKEKNRMGHGLKSILSEGSYPYYSLKETYRLGPRSAFQTGVFYNDQLKSSHRDFNNQDDLDNNIFHKKGGTTLHLMNFNSFTKIPIVGIQEVDRLLYQLPKEAKVAVLTFFVSTAKELQKTLTHHSVGFGSNLIIETVARIQGLSVDYVLYLIPNTGYVRSLNRELFNVATSRAKKNTVIIADKSILNSRHTDCSVVEYLQRI
ncbi:AAA domain-containing protein [Flammeovirga sp. SJP92]|uniref:AAA domain-containing protein n=1 Tax=Flammeovirga sp. SJP92 TaxID=1775430 RepID=UPI0007877825|nr:AAA domain-containing protein [Flammeovirga sp. SJP92]KXX69179.1 hypothetical protein AVL50_16530 [Flammeovirga sp. SJP92]